jgi:hypothetical protein
MGKRLKRDRHQEIENINQTIQRENVELRRLVQMIEEDKERLRIMMLAREERPVGRIPSIRILSPVRYDGINPLCRKSNEEDSYMSATPVEDQSVGGAISTFTSPAKSTHYTPASPVAD